MSDNNEEQRLRKIKEVKSMVINELRDSLAQYVNGLGNHEPGNILELRLFRAIVAAVSKQGFDVRYENLTGGEMVIAHQIATNLLAFLRVLNDDDCLEHIEPSEYLTPSVIDGPLQPCA